MSATTWTCQGCSARWPRQAEIIDFRLQGPSRDDLSFAHRGGLAVSTRRARLLAEYPARSFGALAQLYFDLFETSTEVGVRELATLRDSRALADAWLYQMEQVVPLAELAATKAVAVDVGCGGGGLSIALAERGFQVIGLDADFERLILARKHAESCGIEVLWAAAESEHLPIASGTAGLITCIEVLEHVSDQARTVAEFHRVLEDDGRLYLTTPNRFSLGREPHVRLWAMGYLPRRWMDPYVRWRLGIPYTGKCNPSYAELSRLFRRQFGNRWRVVREKRATYTMQGRMASILSRIPPLGFLVRLVGAGFHVVATR
jgi:2-polyprenyl-3-methyl-5-hydroxy-6-metoxy-1,4-benzoquinol methylase